MDQETKAMGTIIIDGVRLYSFIGVEPQEKLIGNVFEVSAELHFDSGKAMKSDNVHDTINYAEVIRLIKREVDKRSDLLEHVVYLIKNSICEAFPSVTGGFVTLYKLHPPINTELRRVGFRYEW